MYWLIGFICFAVGLALGLIIMGLAAGRRFEEINTYWYSICLGLTDGKGLKDDRDEEVL